jgi:tetratricopeptide (TPR) repeat protein
MTIRRLVVAAVAASPGLFAMSADSCLAQQRNLADLLNQPLPAVVQPAGEAVAVQRDRIGELRRLIDNRDDITNGEGMFSTLRDILREEQEYYGVKIRRVTAAQLVFNAASRQLQIINGLAGGVGVDPNKAADVRNAVDNASTELREAQRDAQRFFQNTLQPLYERVQGKLPQYFASYRSMGNQVPHDRSDPAHDGLVAELQRGVDRCETFVEGHVLLGILHVYAGDAEKAMQDFTKGRDIIAEHGLWESMLGEDLCYGMLLLGRTNEVDDYIKKLKNAAAKGGGSFTANWLIAKHAYAEGKYNEAIKYYNRAVAKAKAEAPAQLLAEAAMQYVVVDDKTDLNKAEKLLKDIGDHRDWRVLRAKAGLAAGHGDWNDATKLIGECAAAAPLGIVGELAEQRAAYQAGEPWWVK